MAERRLAPKQQRFVEEYIVDFNATQAARRAGYSAKTACAIGWENLRKPEIQAAIELARREQTARTKIDADWVLNQLVENVNRAMQAEPIRDNQGEPTGMYTYQGSVANKALELIGRRVGFFPDDAVKVKVDGQMNHEHSGTVVVKATPAERLARLNAAFDESAERAIATDDNETEVAFLRAALRQLGYSETQIKAEIERQQAKTARSNEA